jgi:hypothetical protein
MGWIKRHLSPSLVISIIALCVALGGTAFALATNSVGARELKPIVLREEEHAIAPGATRVIDVKCHSGEQVTGGGIEELGHSPATDVEDSHPRGNGWEGSVTNTGGVTHHADAEALCLKK